MKSPEDLAALVERIEADPFEARHCSCPSVCSCPQHDLTETGAGYDIMIPRRDCPPRETRACAL